MKERKHTDGVDIKHVEEARKRREPPPPRYQPNLTPLIDVLFLLLLFFLLGTKFRLSEGQIDANLPGIGPGNKEAVPVLPTLLKLVVVATGEDSINAQYEFGGQQMYTNPDELCERIKGRLAAGGDVTIQLITRGNVRWKYVVEAFNQAARAGAKKIGFAPIGSGGGML